MIARIVRTPTSDQGTFGHFRFGPHDIFTLELPWRDNARQVSCIPTGVYRCSLVNSPKFGKVYGVHGVTGRSNILIHAANVAGDVSLGWSSQLQGCIAPCERLGAIRVSPTRFQRAGLVSRPALRRLMSWASGQPFTLEIS